MVGTNRTRGGRRVEWACGAVGSALPWHGRGRRFEPDQVHQVSNFSTESYGLRSMAAFERVGK